MLDLVEQCRRFGAGTCDCCHCRTYRAAADELERLRAIVDRLPKTADGVPVTPGMIVYVNIGGDVAACHVAFDNDGQAIVDLGCGIGTQTREAYSTREAAEAAGGNDA